MSIMKILWKLKVKFILAPPQCDSLFIPFFPLNLHTLPSPVHSSAPDGCIKTKDCQKVTVLNKDLQAAVVVKEVKKKTLVV